MSGNTFDAGSIESRLVLDRSDFTDGLREAKAEGENFGRQKFTAKLDVDAHGVLGTIASVRSELAGLRDVNLNVGVTGSNAQIRSISQSASALDGRNINMSVHIAGIADASASLRTLRQQVNALDGRTINIGADFDGAAAIAQIRLMRAELNRLDGQNARTTASTNRLGSSTGLLKGHMMDIVALGMAVAPALFPLADAALGVAGAFTTMGVAVAGAVGIMGAAVFGAVQNVAKLNKELDKAKTNLATQKERLAQLTPGTDAYATQLKKVEEAQQGVNEAQAKFNPAQKAANEGMGHATKAWQAFIDVTQNMTLPIVTTFLNTVAAALPKLVPVVKAMTPEFQAIANSLDRWVRGDGLEKFVGFIISTGVPAFHNLRLAVGNIGTVLGNMFRAFSGQARGMSKSFLDMTKAMADWSNAGGFEKFLQRVNSEAPGVREFMKSLWEAIKNIHAALQPLGMLSLGFVTILLKLVAALPPSWIRAVYVGFIAWRAILGIIVIFKALRTAILAVRTAMFLLSIAFGISPLGWILIAIGAIVAIVVVLGIKFGWFQKIWHATWNGIKTAFSATVEFLRGKFGIIALLLGPIGAIGWIAANWTKVWGAIKVALKAVGDAAVWLWQKALKPTFNAISIGARLLVVVLGTVLFTPLYLLFKVARVAVLGLWNYAFKYVFQAIIIGARLWWTGVKMYFGFVISIMKTLADWAKWLWHKGIKPVFDAITLGAKLWWEGVKLYFNFVIGIFKTLAGWAQWLWKKQIKPVFQDIADGASWLYQKGIKPNINSIVSIFKTLGGWAKWLWQKGIKPFWNDITDGTSLLKDKMISLFDKMKTGIGKVWNALKKIAAVPINFIIDTVYNGGVVKVWNKIADAVGLDKMKLGTVGKIKYAAGGAGPVTGGIAGLDSVNARLMPNEHVWTAEEVRNAGGHQAVAALRANFSSTGKARIGPGAGTVDNSSGSGQKYFLGGGIIDWTKDTLGDAAGGLKNAWDATGGKVVSKAWDALKDVTRGAIGTVATPILKSIKGGVASGVNGVIPGSPPWQALAAGTATKPIDMLLNWIKQDDATHAVGGANVSKALDFAKSQEGKPYVWGGVGPHGYDCSGFMSAIQNVIDGKSPYSRRWATGAFPPGAKGWKRNEKDPFTVGITNAGVGHTAGTLAGVNVESRGGRGVIVGSGARGANNSLFSSQWGYTPSAGGGSAGRWAETVTAVLREEGQYSAANASNVLKAIQKESGGNPNAVNNWDSNAKAGHPSKGLLQVIQGTFDRFAGKYHSKGILDPYANIWAGTRYAKSTYGAGWSARMARPGGYKVGGVTVPGLHMVGEAGPELIASSGGDRVFTATETQQMLRSAGGGSAPIVIRMPDYFIVKIGEYEFRAMLDDETRATVNAMVREAEGSR